MPYIEQDDRRDFEAGLSLLDPATPGELNYLFTMIISRYLGFDPRYSDFNEAVGALECCKLELNRRLISIYEDEKIIQNGDVYYTKKEKEQ